MDERKPERAKQHGDLSGFSIFPNRRAGFT